MPSQLTFPLAANDIAQLIDRVTIWVRQVIPDVDNDEAINLAFVPVLRCKRLGSQQSLLIRLLRVYIHS